MEAQQIDMLDKTDIINTKRSAVDPNYPCQTKTTRQYKSKYNEQCLIGGQETNKQIKCLTLVWKGQTV